MPCPRPFDTHASFVTPLPVAPAALTFATPAPNATFRIGSAPDWPSVVFRTNQSGPHTWCWTIVWKTFSRSGTATTEGNTWDVRDAIENLGGKLTVSAAANGQTATVSVKVIGTNPSRAEVRAYLSRSGKAAGFDDIERASHGKNFTRAGQPTKSLNNGYGMCQVTAPAATFEQCWNWQLNLDGGKAVVATRRPEATSQRGANDVSL